MHILQDMNISQLYLAAVNYIRSKINYLTPLKISSTDHYVLYITRTFTNIY